MAYRLNVGNNLLVRQTVERFTHGHWMGIVIRASVIGLGLLTKSAGLHVIEEVCHWHKHKKQTQRLQTMQRYLQTQVVCFGRDDYCYPANVDVDAGTHKLSRSI